MVMVNPVTIRWSWICRISLIFAISLSREEKWDIIIIQFQLGFGLSEFRYIEGELDEQDLIFSGNSGKIECLY